MPAWRAVRVVAERGGRNRSEALEAPFVGRDEELRLLKDLFHATGAREAGRGSCRVIGPGGHRQDPAGLGVPEVHRRRWSSTSGGTPAAARPTARGSRSGRSARWSAAARACAETDDEATTASAVAATRSRSTCPTRRSAAGSSRRCSRCSASAAARRSARSELFAAWRTFFERMAATAPVVMVFEDLHHADSGPARLHRPPARVESRRRRSPSSPSPGPSSSSGGRTGARASGHFTSIYLEPLADGRHARAARGPRAGPAGGGRRRDRRPRRRHPAVRGRDRPDARSPRAGSCAEGGAYRPTGDLETLAVPETLTALIAARLDGLDPGDRALVAGRRGPRPELHASPGWRPCPAQTARGPRAAAPRAGPARAPRPRRRPALARARPVRVRPGAHPRGRLQHAVEEGPQGPPPRRGALLREPRRPTSWPGRSPATTSRRSDSRRTRPRRTRWRRRRESRSGAPPSGRRPSAPTSRRSTFLEQALEVTTDPADRADLHERAGDSASLVARYDQVEAFLRRAIAIYRSTGDRPSIARATAALGGPCSARTGATRPSSLLGGTAGQAPTWATIRGASRSTASSPGPLLHETPPRHPPGPTGRWPRPSASTSSRSSPTRSSEPRLGMRSCGGRYRRESGRSRSGCGSRRRTVTRGRC